MNKEPMTNFGYEKLCKELKQLKEIDRVEIVKEIDIARSHGDLKENAEYHAAKEKQVFIENRINELSELLTKAQVIDPKELKHEKVSFGSTIKVADIDSEEEFEYTIVGGIESNPNKGLISFGSPLARELLGKEEGDEIKISLPSGTKEYEVLGVYYKEIKF